MLSSEPNEWSLQVAIDSSPIRRYQYFVFALCFICLMIDGFDAYSMAYVGPVLRAEFHLQSTQLGTVFSASLVGMLVGAIVLSWLADRIGRKRVTVGAIAGCGAMMFCTAASHNVSALVGTRFLTGVGLGVLLPNALAICAEFSPMRHRFLIVLLISLGLSAGGAPGGPIATEIMSVFGWRAVFWFGGVASLIVSACVLGGLPESPRFMVARQGKDSPVALRTEQRIFRSLKESAAPSLLPHTVAAQVEIKDLFRHSRAVPTLYFWTITFCNLLCLYFLASWLPTLMRDEGQALSDAVLTGSAMQVGGLPGALFISALAKRFSAPRVLVVNYLAGAIAISLISTAALAGVPFLLATAFVVGMCIIGGQAGIQGVGIDFYPPQLHATGLGWALGVGRLGSIVGPLIAGLLFEYGWSHQGVFRLAAGAGVLASLAAFGLVRLGVGNPAFEK